MAGVPQLRIERFPGRPADGVEEVLFLRVPSDPGLIDPAVELLISACAERGRIGRQSQFRLRVSIAEAISNAIECGNQCDPTKQVAVQADLLTDWIRIAVTDEGTGFDPAEVPDPTTPERLENPCGRGLLIIRHLAERVGFNDKGNTIWMTLPRR
jgi:serine/threonine-protein kinase RsbW